ncbi:CHC2 zinc finger domain-containing protein [Coraliomargarita sp. SDUM461004]|uniref:CHC2 zinc finger domain-containing protein n=1 Tax=Thalassobacterium sedimentorum TaxID=3041258 RepID=A0ABU1AEZ8_9BACT|nr:CHC2 zinc finger domain-containing protein [Coraliomargarita sp. SDUM461004]MDQ8193382.1 CHC2 zinc finger domain-containing protein [Coraliomargarita sp. SDUM461004]
MIDLDQIKAAVTIPDAWRKLGLPGEPRPGCIRSPFREDRKPSFSISSDGKRFKDFATGESGDVLDFVMEATGKDFTESLAWLTGGTRAFTLKATPKPAQRSTEPTRPFTLPAIDDGSIEDLDTVARSRRFDGWYGLQLAISAGHLGFCQYRGRRCWIAYDDAGRVAQVRRVDGLPFNNGAKALTLSGSNARYPIGASSIRDMTTTIYLCEGLGDWLSAISMHAFEDEGEWSAVCMLGASMKIDELSLAKFVGKRVIIYAQHDDAGRNAAQVWANQLKPFAAQVTAMMPDIPGSDLNDAFVEQLESENNE